VTAAHAAGSVGAVSGRKTAKVFWTQPQSSIWLRSIRWFVQYWESDLLWEGTLIGFFYKSSQSGTNTSAFWASWSGHRPKPYEPGHRNLHYSAGHDPQTLKPEMMRCQLFITRFFYWIFILSTCLLASAAPPKKWKTSDSQIGVKESVARICTWTGQINCRSQ
jgi:hypothetical protein